MKIAAGVTGTAVAMFGATGAAAMVLPSDKVRKWDYEADIVVLGAGGAGFVTAIAAHDKGAKVLILEKMSEALSGGNTRCCGQGFWSPTGDKGDAVAYQKALNDGYPVPDDVVDLYIDYMRDNYRWIESLGGKGFARGYPEYSHFPGAACCKNSDFHLSEPGDNGQMVMGKERVWKLLKENVLKRKIRIVYEAAGVALIQDPKSKEIRGVLAEHKDRKIHVKAKKAVSLCTGGFEGNQDMVRDYLQMAYCYPKGTPYNTGDGIKMAQAAGADLWHMDNLAGPDYNFKPPDKDWTFGYRFSPVGQSWIWVAKDGTRFTNEAFPTKHGKIPFHGIFIPTPAPLPVHCIFDEALMKSGAIYPPGNLTNFCWFKTIEHYTWSSDNSVELSKGWIVRADSLSELAAKIRKDPTAIEKTVATFNQYATAGKDPEFGRPNKRMAPLQKAPFYAMELVPSFTNTQGGPRRNKFCQVLDTDGKVIPRLYSGGELGSVSSWYYQAGSNIGECIALGRVAGERAAAEKAWK